LGWFSLLADEFLALNKHIAARLAFLSNLVLFGEIGYFDSASNNKILLHLWSLGIEEQLYILWPLLLIFFCRLNGVIKNGVHHIGVLLFIFLCGSFIFNIAFISSHPTATFYLPVTRVWELLIGAALAYRTVVQNRPLTLCGSPNINSWLGFSLLIAANIFISDKSPFPSWRALLPTISAVLFISAGSLAWFNQRVLGSRLLIWFGLISYPLYLWHWPLLTFARILDGGRQPSAAIRTCIVLLAILLAWLTYRLIEKPIRFSKNLFFTPIRLFLFGVTFFWISSFALDFNPSMQHTTNCVSARSVAHETTTSNLLHGHPEGFNVGALETRRFSPADCPVI
jgi:peptidoglycan/LPS O-acetylase OafA/YrhL